MVRIGALAIAVAAAAYAQTKWVDHPPAAPSFHAGGRQIPFHLIRHL